MCSANIPRVRQPFKNFSTIFEKLSLISWSAINKIWWIIDLSFFFYPPAENPKEKSLIQPSIGRNGVKKLQRRRKRRVLSKSQSSDVQLSHFRNEILRHKSCQASTCQASPCQALTSVLLILIASVASGVATLPRAASVAASLHQSEETPLAPIDFF